MKTLGHERIHVMQKKLYGETQDTGMGKLFEDAAYGSEDDWWEYFKLFNKER